METVQKLIEERAKLKTQQAHKENEIIEYFLKENEKLEKLNQAYTDMIKLNNDHRVGILIGLCTFVGDPQQRLDIKNEICEIKGHEWTPWIEYACQFQDRSWNYKRTCECCGLIEKEKPLDAEYITEDQWKKQLKERK